MGVPERIGRYPIVAELGQGAMGTVYRARDERLDRDVAVKVMSKGAADADGRARFLREARAAARLQHPNIVVVYELGEHDGAPFMVLELLEGIDLQRAIEDGLRPDPRVTLPVVLQLLAGLGHAHAHGIVHRDVKPSNVFLPRGQPAKVMDFGVARLAGPGTTTTGVVVGTPSYMSPEQVAGGEIDGRSDLFSTGLILYELVTGEKAFRADNLVSIVYKIAHESPDLGLIPGGREWERLRAVLERALAREAQARYPDARAMASDLGQALAELGGTAEWSAPADQALLVRRKPAPGGAPTLEIVKEPARSPASSPPPSGEPEGRPAPPPARSSRLPVLAAGLVALVALAALAGTWAWRRAPVVSPPSPEPAAVAPTASAVPGPLPTTARPQPSPPSPTATPAGAKSAAPGPPATVVPVPAPELSTAERLRRAEDFVAHARWAEALAEARAVLASAPRDARAAALAQRAEEEQVVEECVGKAREALREGDRERAEKEVRRGFVIRKNDPRLLALFREVMQQQ